MSLQPRNNDILDELERQATQQLAAMARGSLQTGQLPPRSVLEWYTMYVTEALIATESMAQQITHETPKEEAEAVSQQLEMCVVALSDLLHHLNGNKLLVLIEAVQSKLRARALYLPTDFDTSYEGMLPKV